MINARAFLLLFALLSTPTWPAVAAPTSAELAPALTEALGSGSFERVRALFQSPRDPILAELAREWRAWSERELDVQGWEITFEPYSDRPGHVLGVLSIAARLADDRLLGHRWPVRLVRRGSRYLVGEAIAYERQDTQLMRHDLTLDLRGGPGRLAVTDRLTLKPLGPDRDVFLRLDPQLAVSAVTADDAPIPFKQHGETLYFERPAGAAPSRVTLRYAGPVADTGWDFVRPEGTVLRSGEFVWYARQPGTPPFSVYSMRVLVPPGERAVAVGSLDGIDRFADHWAYQWTTGVPVEGMTVYAGAYDVVEGLMGELKLEADVPRGRRAVAERLLMESARVLDFYGQRLGEYPYRKFALVETGFPHGFGASSAVSLPHDAFEDPALADEFLAHEIAHNWTDMVRYSGPLGEQGLMAEGLASYLDLLYHEHRDGPQAFREGLRQTMARVMSLMGTKEDVPLRRVDRDGDRLQWQLLAYDKGAMILHMLHEQIGEAAFYEGLRTLYTEHRGRAITLADFQEAFERAGKTHLGAFFDQWLNRAGLPVVQAAGVAVEADPDGGYRIHGTLAQAGKPYFLTVPLVVVADDAQVLYHVPVRGLETPFQLICKSKPRFLLVDPLGDTLIAPSDPLALR